MKGDGSWTQLDGEARPKGTGKLSEAGLTGLRTALREADFARLPRIATGGPTIYDGYSYVFVHDGHEVSRDQGSLPASLTKVLDALPPFTGGQDAPKECRWPRCRAAAGPGIRAAGRACPRWRAPAPTGSAGRP